MNLHPLLVHFPIAIWTLYTLFEIISIKKIQEKAYWFYVKASLVIAGGIFFILAYATGDEYGGTEKIREIHESFAGATGIVFGVMAVIYLLVWIKREWPSMYVPFLPIVCTWAEKILNSPLRLIIPVMGFILLSITGGLGGSMVYGKDIDPFTQIIYKIFKL